MRLFTILLAPTFLTSTLVSSAAITLNNTSIISPELFVSLEELARIVDISYCVGTTGIHKPFECASRCHEFQGFELVEQWKTGVLMSDSCGYIALSHPPFEKRVVVAFRGTYSIANTVVDLSTTPAEYLPYPEDGDEDGQDGCVTAAAAGGRGTGVLNSQKPMRNPSQSKTPPATRGMPGKEENEPCNNCTVHAGFLTAWHNTRCTILPLIENALLQHPDYQLTLVGHSLGGAVAALASLEFLGRGWEPQVTTFGEPRVGNQALVNFIDRKFKMDDQESKTRTYRRVTHVDDPVPLLPLDEWGYKMHAGEIFISKRDLSPSRYDIHHCAGDADGTCISGEAEPESDPDDKQLLLSLSTLTDLDLRTLKSLNWPLHVPNRYRLWELFFAHRDYFWRLGLCVPRDWWKVPFQRGGGGDEDEDLGEEEVRMLRGEKVDGFEVEL